MLLPPSLAAGRFFPQLLQPPGWRALLIGSVPLLLLALLARGLVCWRQFLPPPGWSFFRLLPSQVLSSQVD